MTSTWAGLRARLTCLAILLCCCVLLVWLNQTLLYHSLSYSELYLVEIVHKGWFDCMSHPRHPYRLLAKHWATIGCRLKHTAAPHTATHKAVQTITTWTWTCKVRLIYNLPPPTRQLKRREVMHTIERFHNLFRFLFYCCVLLVWLIKALLYHSLSRELYLVNLVHKGRLVCLIWAITFHIQSVTNQALSHDRV